MTRTGQGTPPGPSSTPAASALAAAYAGSSQASVDTAALRPARRGGIGPKRVARNSRAVAWWLLGLAGLVLAMVVLGGITRLNHAGLSIVDWRPLVGVLPPFGEEAWQALFVDYKRFPEYQELNPGMTLAGFKEIFWLEYAHRLLGRIVGIAFALPFIWFLIRRAFDRPLAVKVLAIGVLGGLQGLLGWYMVKSGLVDRPDVSPYRLAAHLGLAVAIYGCLIWVALGLLTGGSVECVRRAGRWRGAIWGATGLVFLTRSFPELVRRRQRRGPRLQHLPAHGRCHRAARYLPDRAAVAELLRECAPGAARPPTAGDADRADRDPDLGRCYCAG